MRIEIRDHQDEETGNQYRAMFVDGELFDWGIDPYDLHTANKLIEEHPEMRKSVMGDIEQHLVSCFSEFIGREVTLAEINAALAGDDR